MRRLDADLEEKQELRGDIEGWTQVNSQSPTLLDGLTWLSLERRT